MKGSSKEWRDQAGKEKGRGKQSAAVATTGTTGGAGGEAVVKTGGRQVDEREKRSQDDTRFVRGRTWGDVLSHNKNNNKHKVRSPKNLG